MAAVRAAELNELLAPEADRAGAAIAAADIDLGLVEELHGGDVCLCRVGLWATKKGNGPAVPLVNSRPEAGYLAGRLDRNERAPAGAALEPHGAIRCREDRMILADADIQARV